MHTSNYTAGFGVGVEGSLFILLVYNGDMEADSSVCVEKSKVSY